MAVLLVPIILLNFFSGIVGGIWLAVQGEWHLVGYGVAIAAFGVVFASILLMPGIALVLPLAKLAEKGGTFSSLVLGSVGLVYTYAVMAAWAIVIFLWFAGETRHAIPCILWAYSTATVTWSYLAQKEAATNEYSAVTSVFHQFGCIALMIYTYSNYRRPEWSEMAIWYGVPMAVGIAFQLFLVFSNTRRYQRY